MQNCVHIVENCFKFSIKRCTKCCNAFGNIFDKLCTGTCIVFGKTCIKVSDGCGNVFKGPLSFCFAITLAFSLTPIIFGFIGYGSAYSAGVYCKKPIRASVVVLCK